MLKIENFLNKNISLKTFNSKKIWRWHFPITILRSIALRSFGKSMYRCANRKQRTLIHTFANAETCSNSICSFSLCLHSNHRQRINGKNYQFDYLHFYCIRIHLVPVTTPGMLSSMALLLITRSTAMCNYIILKMKMNILSCNMENEKTNSWTFQRFSDKFEYIIFYFVGRYFCVLLPQRYDHSKRESSKQIFHR